MTPVIDAASAYAARHHVLFLDVRHELTDPNAGWQAFRTSRIPGAIFIPVDTALSGQKTGQNGRHPLPTLKAFTSRLQELGMSASQKVIAYDAHGGQFASRLWWMLSASGYADCQVLDGGWGAWRSAGLPVDESLLRDVVHQQPPLEASAEPWPNTVEVCQVLEAVQAGVNSPIQLLDARAANRFAGEVEPLDPVAGHIPGAWNRPFQANLESSGCFKPAQELRREYLDLLGARAPAELVHQCGSGISACHNLLAMAYAGLEGSRLYPGSWSEWCADPKRPVARGHGESPV